MNRITLAAACLAFSLPAWAQQTTLPPADRHLARDIFAQLIDINTTHSSGSTGEAAEAMRKRLLDAGFPAEDLQVLGPDPRHNNLVARYGGTPSGTKKPVLIIAHLDVVEARREDWNSDPFHMIEKDGFFYGRGTQDMKDSDAAEVISFIRLRREGYVPDRDIILALTAGEEGGEGNGVDWLLKNKRTLIDAAFALNPDAGGLTTTKGKPLNLGVEATEKLYADFEVAATNPGGHSSVPVPDNALYHVADALSKIEHYTFPFELNAVTRAYYAELAKVSSGQQAADMRSVISGSPDPAAIVRLSEDPHYNSIMRTTCVATMMEAGHAPNALPQRAAANVNCRILPGHTPGEIRKVLASVINDSKVTIRLNTDGVSSGEDELSVTPPPLNEEVFAALNSTAHQIWPGVPVIPQMETGASDSKITMAAGIPSYGFSGMGIDEDDDRAHGQDERIGVESFYTGVQFNYLFLKALTGSRSK